MPHVFEDVAHGVVGLSWFRVEGNCAGDGFEGFVEQAFGLEGGGAVGVGVGEIGVEADGGVAFGDCLIESCELGEAMREVAVGARVVGIEADGGCVCVDGFFGSAAVAEGDAEVVVCLGEIGFECDGLGEF